MILVCLIGGIAGLVFRPQFLVLVIAVFAAAHLGSFVFPALLAPASLSGLAGQVVALNLSYLAGACLRGFLRFR
ncbi:hypothetical protein [Pseudorhizobium pelagicum]|uniref:Uncharacterized protein n=1 Tax=Pseudorhizobium pelagicum TaxID=1509405 RepID=A0A922NZA3_9HYPH|nr:hypothetical protein [Pseudorhizobium pelagicum]KEQ04496.1 hypothetical protein GV67_08280 [Pseudorhizobium pelagicum]KEQ06656.1 hypothetical protein GV68_06255 [Pseudorhizobium pelagicum]